MDAVCATPARASPLAPLTLREGGNLRYDGVVANYKPPSQSVRGRERAKRCERGMPRMESKRWQAIRRTLSAQHLPGDPP